jgi:hypothetical protein
VVVKGCLSVDVFRAWGLSIRSLIAAENINVL